jgi:hypothetical protein
MWIANPRGLGFSSGRLLVATFFSCLLVLVLLIDVHVLFFGCGLLCGVLFSRFVLSGLFLCRFLFGSFTLFDVTVTYSISRLAVIDLVSPLERGKGASAFVQLSSCPICKCTFCIKACARSVIFKSSFLGIFVNAAIFFMTVSVNLGLSVIRHAHYIS